jgi:hemerythrin-like domain-containing protein
MEGGPTHVMRAEHKQIGQALEAIHKKVQAQDPESDQEEQALSDLLRVHNQKEERMLYPAIDSVLTAQDRGAVYDRMRSVPEERYSLCCGQH